MLQGVGKILTKKEVSNYSVSFLRQENGVEEWNRYASSDPSGAMYHLVEWSKILEKSFGYLPYHLLVKNERREICGILPLVLIKSSITGNRLVSLPFSYVCGPVVHSDAALNILLHQANILCKTLKCRYLEIKVVKNEDQLSNNSPWKKYNFEVSDQFSTFILKLAEPEVVWKKLDPKSVRWAIGKAMRDGVLVRKGNTLQDIRNFYKLNLKVKKRIGVPGHPEYMFINMFGELGDKCSLYLAEFQGEIIGGIITQKHNSTVLYGYGASNDDYRSHQPNSLLVWTAIEEACREGYQYFDFGRTSPVEQGVTSFKKHWGTEEKRLSYFYYPRIPNSMALNDTGLKYRVARNIWKKLPLSLAQIGSNIIFKHLG